MNMVAHLKQLNFCHGNGDCQGMPIPNSLFLTSNEALLVAAQCLNCGDEFQLEIPLEDLIAACPGIPRPASAYTLITADDIAFLRALRIDPNLENSESRKKDTR